MVTEYCNFLRAGNGGPCGPGCMHTQLDVVGGWRPLVNGESLVLYLSCSAWNYSTANHLVCDYIPGSCRLHLNKALFTVSVLHLPAASAKFQCTINTCICQVSLNPLSAQLSFLYLFVMLSTVVCTNIIMCVQNSENGQYFTWSALCVHTCTDVACCLGHWRIALLVQLQLLVYVQA